MRPAKKAEKGLADRLDPLEILDRPMEIVGERNCTTSPTDLYVHAFDGGIHRRKPDAVVRPHRTEEVQEIIAFANEKKIPSSPGG